jgi:cytochrome c oxidase subunit 2
VWELSALVSRGKQVYGTNCVACHQATGKGAGAIKPLDGSAVVLNSDHTEVISTLLNGRGNGAMPAWKQLSDTEIAAVITYAKNSWSNQSGDLIQPAEVQAARNQ